SAVLAGPDRPRAYYGLMLFLIGAIVGVFTTQDLLVFYVMFEAMLIPLYVLVGVWGGAGRLGATLKFVAYTMAGSLLMLVSIIAFGLTKGTFDLVDSGTSGSNWSFLGFAAAVAVTAPLCPFHRWLPDADGAVLQMVNHGLVSATLFLLAGAIERRTATGEFLLLGGMARGRPALATLLMTTGVIALAVPGSTAFAGELLVLAGVFQQYWLYGVTGAAAIVLAAMYVLRLISGVLHQDVGSAVSDAARDLVPGEVAILVPLVGCLLALSVWPAAVSEHSFASLSSRSSALGSQSAEELLAACKRLHRSEEHTSELQSPYDLVCRLLLEKKKKC